MGVGVWRLRVVVGGGWMGERSGSWRGGKGRRSVATGFLLVIIISNSV